MEPWSLLVLDNDEGSKQIAAFFKKIWSKKIKVYNKLREKAKLLHKNDLIHEMAKATEGLEGKILTLYGSGAFHHYTYGLCHATAKQKSKDYIYIHFDNHADCWYFGDCDPTKNPYLECGCFVENILEEPEAKGLIFIGTQRGNSITSSTNIHPIFFKDKTAKKKLKKELAKKSQKDVYLSFDLDVLNEREMITDYDAGKLTILNLLEAIDVIQEEKNIISADILGYVITNSRPFNEKSKKQKKREKQSRLFGYDPISLLGYAILAAKITEKDAYEIWKLHDYFLNKCFNKSPSEINKEFLRFTKDLKI